jgi:hypothetical protein
VGRSAPSAVDSAFNLTAHESKFFCPNIGFVSAITLSDGVREELVGITPPP